MVDSRKSAQAKQQRRNRDGTYADEAKLVACRAGTSLNVSNNVSKPILVMRRLKPMRQA